MMRFNRGRLSFGEKYEHLHNGAACQCHSPEARSINHRMTTAMSRRSFIAGAGAILAAANAGFAKPVFAQTPDKPILLKNISIFDGVLDKLIVGKGILVRDGKIEAFVDEGDVVSDATVIDGAGMTAMPGLIDMHWHSMLAAIPMTVAMTADIGYLYLVAAQEAENTLMRGFTTVRDVGGPSFALKRAIDETRFMGPRIYPAGAMISQTSGHGDFRMRTDIPRSSQSNLSAAETAGISVIADGSDEVLRRTREQLMLGASQIKIMVGGGVSSFYDPLDSIQFTAAEIQAAVNAASDWGTYVCAHVYTSAGIKRALDNGVQCIEHGQLADDETIRRIADEGVWWSIQPFLADSDANPKSVPEAREQQIRIAEGTVRCFELGQKYNARMAWGTDILFNPVGTTSQTRQLAKTAQWFGNFGALKMATSTNAELLKMSGDRNPYKSALGVLEPKAYADILLVDANPLDDISLISDPEKNFRMIMKNGVVCKNTLT
ncbi:amidohydrolase family protein [Brucella pseudogrignonensis]|uniref:Imidazolonepropionase-like amidohydrolase n=1 Tax=Brucella pseudogrignonensis TaxID=419475 RepID=A0ABU1MFI2_9HYPH|nr:amidohydrolase family protein [Brucella pseudogrignonensis]MDR6434824.1 imidazolonepropionase-like amidohydrolase [Brucella pseudogrignonensis]